MKKFSIFARTMSNGGIAAISMTLLVATLAGCGGGGDSTPTPSPSPSVSPLPIAAPTVSLTADPQDILRGQSARLLWSSQNTSAVVGSNFDAATLAGEKAVAPLTTTTYTLTVGNVSGQSAVSTVEVRVATVAIAATPSPATIDVSASLSFAAQVSGAVNTSVTWSVQELGGGTISGDGVYTASPIAGVYHVLATSNADTSKVAVVEVRVRAATGSVNIN